MENGVGGEGWMWVDGGYREVRAREGVQHTVRHHQECEARLGHHSHNSLTSSNT